MIKRSSEFDIGSGEKETLYNLLKNTTTTTTTTTTNNNNNNTNDHFIIAPVRTVN